MSQSINLIKERSQIPGYLEPVQLQLKIVALVVLGLTVIIGAITLIAYTAINVQTVALNASKKNYTRKLDDLRPIESMFLVIKSRISVVRKAMESAMPVSTLFSTVTAISDSPQLQSIHLSENGQVSFESAIGSVEEAVSMVATIKELTKNQSMTIPYLSSLSISEDGMRVSFTYKQSFNDTL